MSTGISKSPPAAVQKIAGQTASTSKGAGSKDRAPRSGDSSISSPTAGQESSPADASGSVATAPAITGRRRGTVKFFDTQKGFGFINDYRPEELNDEEVFVHYTSIAGKTGFRSLAEGEVAEYDVVRGGKGFSATNVTGPGGQALVGDTRNRAVRNNFVPQMSPFGALYPYIQQDSASFYQPSPYNQPQMLMQGDFHTYRNPGPYAGAGPPSYPTANAPYRTPPMQSLSPATGFGLPSFTPSPFGSPAYRTPLDLPKDYSAAFAGVTLEDDGRNKPTYGQAPFGGMFGPVPSYVASGLMPPQLGLAGPPTEVSASSAALAQQGLSQAGYRSVVPPQMSQQSGPFDAADRLHALSMSSAPLTAGPAPSGQPTSTRASASSTAPARPKPTQSVSSSATHAPAPVFGEKNFKEW